MNEPISLNGTIINIGGSMLGLTCITPSDITVSPTTISSIPYTCTTCSVSVCGHECDKTYVSTACNWLVVSSPVYPASSPGTSNDITICCNSGAARSGVVCYTPNVGDIKCVTLCQLGSVTVSTTCLSCAESTTCMCCCGCLSYSPTRPTNDCYYPSFCWYLCKSATAIALASCVQILCNGTCIYCCVINSKSLLSCTGSFALRCVDYNDCINIITLAQRDSATGGCYAYADVFMCAITQCVGSYAIGATEQTSYTGILP
jgi:hypothetical protein